MQSYNLYFLYQNILTLFIHFVSFAVYFLLANPINNAMSIAAIIISVILFLLCAIHPPLAALMVMIVSLFC